MAVILPKSTIYFYYVVELNDQNNHDTFFANDQCRAAFTTSNILMGSNSCVIYILIITGACLNKYCNV